MAEQKLDPKVKSLVNRFNAVSLFHEACKHQLHTEEPPLSLEMGRSILNALPNHYEELVKSDLVFKALPRVLDIEVHAHELSYNALKHNKLVVFAELLRRVPPATNSWWKDLRTWAQKFKREEAIQLLESLHEFKDA